VLIKKYHLGDDVVNRVSSGKLLWPCCYQGVESIVTNMLMMELSRCWVNGYHPSGDVVTTTSWKKHGDDEVTKVMSE
jgi:hypothetical protein